MNYQFLFPLLKFFIQAVGVEKGLENICLDIEFMLKRKVGVYWRICWGVIVPTVMISVFVYFVITLEDLTYEDRSYPTNVIIFGWILLGVGVMQPFVWWIIEIIKRNRKTYCLSAMKYTISHDNWGPKEEKHAKKWKEFKMKSMSMRELKSRNWFMNKLCILIGRE